MKYPSIKTYTLINTYNYNSSAFEEYETTFSVDQLGGSQLPNQVRIIGIAIVMEVRNSTNELLGYVNYNNSGLLLFIEDSQNPVAYDMRQQPVINLLSPDIKIKYASFDPTSDYLFFRNTSGETSFNVTVYTTIYVEL